jgi:hypothetical protein
MNTTTLTPSLTTALSLYSQASTHAKELPALTKALGTHAKELRHYLVVSIGLTILAGMHTRTWCEQVWTALESNPLTNWGVLPTPSATALEPSALEQFSDEAIEQWLALAPSPAPRPCAPMPATLATLATRTIRSLRTQPQAQPPRRPHAPTTVVPAGGDLRP